MTLYAYKKYNSVNYSNLRNDVVSIDGNSYYVKKELTSDFAARNKNFTVSFAQTFDKGTANYINNGGMSPNPSDAWGAAADFTQNFQVCGDYGKYATDKNYKYITALFSRRWFF